MMLRLSSISYSTANDYYVVSRPCLILSSRADLYLHSLLGRPIVSPSIGGELRWNLQKPVEDRKSPLRWARKDMFDCQLGLEAHA